MHDLPNREFHCRTNRTANCPALPRSQRNSRARCFIRARWDRTRPRRPGWPQRGGDAIGIVQSTTPQTQDEPTISNRKWSFGRRVSVSPVRLRQPSTALWLAVVSSSGRTCRHWPCRSIPRAWLSTAIALGIAPSVVFCYEIVYLHPAESMWPVVLPLVLLLSFPAPLIGCSITKLLTRIRLPQAVYPVVVMGALIMGIRLPNLQNLWLRRVESVTVPSLLKQIYEAEMIYSASHPEANFVCDGTLLPGAAGKLGWQHGDSSMIT
jgi:hypothetical protein